jgi:uroporphyrinogen-III decarboxylase
LRLSPEAEEGCKENQGQMNSRQRVETVLRGETPDRVPVCLHNFWLAAKEAGVPLEQYLTQPEAAARVHLCAVEKYGYDCILIDLDTTMLAEAMGAKRDCTPDEPGHIAAPAINSLGEAGRLKPVNPQRDGRIPVLLEAVRIMAREVGDRIAIRANADQGAFSLACHICGNTTAILEQLAQYPACGFELDHKTDARRAKTLVGAGHVLFGNVDPSGVLARGTPAQVREATRQLIELWKPGGRFILNAGCAIPPTTPAENLRAFIQTAREFGTYETGQPVTIADCGLRIAD